MRGCDWWFATVYTRPHVACGSGRNPGCFGDLPQRSLRILPHQFTGEFATFNKEAADLLLEIGVIKQIPDLGNLADTRFIE